MLRERAHALILAIMSAFDEGLGGLGGLCSYRVWEVPTPPRPHLPRPHDPTNLPSQAWGAGAMGQPRTAHNLHPHRGAARRLEQPAPATALTKS
eukprot:COSAG02_NODE_19416_length_883_cov_0.704082_1_plen_94_part_00